MPDVILHIAGWTRIQHVPDHIHERVGQVRIAVQRPLSLYAVAEGAENEATIGFDMLIFRRTHRSFNGMVVYDEEHTP